MDTVVQSRSKTVVIGPEQPFCVIGERINPTGRKAFQAQLQAGDLSQLETDVAQQVEGGADMLDVNVGDPLADEVALMGQAIPLVQQLTDIPLCIDSSIIEALEAGLEAYEGKALVNSVTGEDERLEAILPIVAKYGAAVIGLANAEDIPMEAARRVEIAKKIVSVAGDYGIPPEDVIIDPLAMPIGAVTRSTGTMHRGGNLGFSGPVRTKRPFPSTQPSTIPSMFNDTCSVDQRIGSFGLWLAAPGATRRSPRFKSRTRWCFRAPIHRPFSGLIHHE